MKVEVVHLPRCRQYRDEWVYQAIRDDGTIASPFFRNKSREKAEATIKRLWPDAIVTWTEKSQPVTPPPSDS